MRSKNDACRMSLTEEALNDLQFWPSLTEQEQETLRRSAFVRHYEKGAFVHSSDTECLGMLFVLSGEIRTYLLSEEGREVIHIGLQRLLDENIADRNHACCKINILDGIILQSLPTAVPYADGETHRL